LTHHRADAVAHLDDLLDAIAAAGPASATMLPMSLRAGTRGCLLDWRATHYPVPLYRHRQLYGRGAYVAPEYSEWLRARLAP
jgi:hypothetical protein